MNSKKGLKHYAMIFIFATAAIAIFAVIQILQNGSNFEPNSLVALLIIPVTFTFFLFLFDRVLLLVIPDRWKETERKETEFEKFVKGSIETLSKGNLFSLEERRRLFETEKFNRSLSQVFTIEKHGESEHLSHKIILKKYKKDTNEYKALLAVIESLKNQ